MVDVRIARGGRASNWTDQGFSIAKGRYEGTGSVFHGKRSTRLVFSQLAIELGATLPWGVSTRAQINAETDIDVDRSLLIEVILRKKWPTPEGGWELQVGIMTNPFSLEHARPAWTQQYTHPSPALNGFGKKQGKARTSRC